MSPAASIILPTFNRLDYLREAVESVRAQTMSGWELIVVDDGSTDDTVAWLESLAEPRMIILKHEHTGNPALLRNVAIALARAEWIAFLDSDDRWVPQKLERQLALHAGNPHLRWSYTGREMIDAGGAALPTNRFKQWEAHSGWILQQVLALDANIPLPSVMVQRSLLREVGGFDASWPWSDYELWLRLAEGYECGLVAEPLLEVRSHRSATFGDPRVNLGLADMYRGFAERTMDPRLRSTARARQAMHLVRAADESAVLGRWADARAAVAAALRLRPFAPFVYRAAGRLLRRALTRTAARNE
ncbi:MAG: glycosyltransferase family A protein [bacterium]